MKILVSTILFISMLHFSFAQTTEKEVTLSLDSGTIEQQFDFLKKKSSTYQIYRMIKKSHFAKFRSNVKDSLFAIQKQLNENKVAIALQKKEYTALQEKLDSVTANLKNVSETKNNISFLGMSLSKATFKIAFWTIIGLLSLILGFFIYSFKNSNKITTATLANFSELEEEYNNSKTRALEREQILNRKLQDQLNKNK